MLHVNITALCLIERELLPIEVLHCGYRNFRPFWPLNLDLGPMSFICQQLLDPRVRGGIPRVQLNLLRQGFRKLSSDGHTDRQTCRHDQNYIPRRFVGGQIFSITERRAVSLQDMFSNCNCCLVTDIQRD